MMMEGWKCPNCGGAHAPWMPSCPVTVTITSTPGPIQIQMADCGCPPSELPCPNSFCPRRPVDRHTSTVSEQA